MARLQFWDKSKHSDRFFLGLDLAIRNISMEKVIRSAFLFLFSKDAKLYIYK